MFLLDERGTTAVAVREWQSNAKLLRLIEVLQDICSFSHSASLHLYQLFIEFI